MKTKTKIIVIVTTIVAAVCGFGGFFVLRIVDYPMAAGELPQAIKDAKAVGIPITAAELSTTGQKSAAPATFSVLKSFNGVTASLRYATITIRENSIVCG